MTATVVENVFQSKWGFHPCDHTTFIKLKRLNKFVQLAKRLNAQWARWERKQPQNRFVKTTTRSDGKSYRAWAYDAKGNRIPCLEPVHVSGKLTSFSAEVEKNYFRARFPVAEPSSVKPITLHDIDAEIKSMEKWYKEAGQVEV